MDTTNGPLFKMGIVVATAEAALALAKSRTQPEELLDQHASGMFGEVKEQQRRANLDAIRDGGRIVSIFTVASGDRLHVVTESNWSSTTILLEGEA